MKPPKLEINILLSDLIEEKRNILTFYEKSKKMFEYK